MVVDVTSDTKNVWDVKFETTVVEVTVVVVRLVEIGIEVVVEIPVAVRNDADPTNIVNFVSSWNWILNVEVKTDVNLIVLKTVKT